MKNVIAQKIRRVTGKPDDGLIGNIDAHVDTVQPHVAARLTRR